MARKLQLQQLEVLEAPVTKFVTKQFKRSGILQPHKGWSPIEVSTFLEPEGYTRGTNFDVPSKFRVNALTLDPRYNQVVKINGEFWVHACPARIDKGHVKQYLSDIFRTLFLWYRIQLPKDSETTKVVAQAVKPEPRIDRAIKALYEGRPIPTKTASASTPPEVPQRPKERQSKHPHYQEVAAQKRAAQREKSKAAREANIRARDERQLERVREASAQQMREQEERKLAAAAKEIVTTTPEVSPPSTSPDPDKKASRRKPWQLIRGVFRK